MLPPTDVKKNCMLCFLLGSEGETWDYICYVIVTPFNNNLSLKQEVFQVITFLIVSVHQFAESWLTSPSNYTTKLQLLYISQSAFYIFRIQELVKNPKHQLV